MIVRVTSAPASLLSLEECKAQLRVDGTDDEQLITDLASAITGMIDGPFGMAGAAFGSQTIEMVINGFPGDICVPVPGANSIDSITYYDSDNAQQTLTVATYFTVTKTDHGLYLEEKQPAPQTYDRIDAVTITIDAGGTVPERIKQAAKLTLAAWYDNRTGDIPVGAKALIDLERHGWISA